MTRWRRIAIYVRVSKEDQHLEQQEAALRRWLEGRGEVVVFTETESSTKRRPVLDAMLLRVRQREFDAVAVWAFNRFARSARELLMWLDEFKALGVEFISQTEGLDTSTPIGRAMFTIIAALAELERSQISQRTKERLAFLKAKGVRLGRRPVEYDAERAQRLVAKGLSSRKLARALGVSKSKAALISAKLRRPSKGVGRKRPSPSSVD